ncbi:MAG: hypothetical protein LBI29_03595, partial [Rickettsiales bacterium]|nr:hypothetical protein [Rickettsiales bacterium]
NRSSRLVRKKRGLEGKGTILWPNGIGYEGLFENNLIKNNPNGKLILFPEEDGYTVEFLDAGYAFPNAYYFNNTSYDSENKLLRFADGDIFKGISSENTKGIFLSRSGTEVEDTLRNVLVGKMEEEEKIRKSDPKKETKFILLGRGEDNVIELKGNYRENKKMLEKAAINEYVADSYSKDDGEVILTFDNGDTFVGNLGTEARGTYTFKNGTVVENELLSTVMENMEEKRRVNRKKEENILILRNIFSVSITRIIKGDGYMLFGMSNGYEYILGNGAILENNGEEVLVQAISGTADGTAPRIEFTDKFSEEMEKIGVENSVELLDGIYGSNPYRCFGNICIYVPSSKGDSLYLGDYRAKVDADTSLVTMEPYGYGFHILPDGNVLIVNGEKAEEAEEIFLYSRYGLAVLNGTPVIIDEENYEEKQEGAAPIEDFSAAEEPEDKMEEKTLLQTATTYAWKMNGCATSPLEDGIECTYCSEEEENRSK